MRSLIVSAAVAAATIIGPVVPAQARDQIRIVGSSTVFPFSTTVAERFGRSTEFKTPVVESTGSGGGMKLFCSGTGERTPDITNASRRIKASELALCSGNGVHVTEVRIGFDGIVLARDKRAPRLDLTTEQIFLALAEKIPSDGKLIPNPNQKWSDIDPSFPDTRIEVLGPPPTSGTRDAFVEIAMEGGCKTLAGAAELGLEKQACHVLREDGAFIEAGENDNLIVQKLQANPDAIGVFGYSFLDQNRDRLQGSKLAGVEPTFENIADGKYAISRSLYFYVKREHAGTVPGVMGYVKEFTSERAWGPEGYLVDKGLIPLDDEQRARAREQALALTELSKL